MLDFSRLLCSTKTPEKVWLFCNVSIESRLNQAAKKWLSAPLTPLPRLDAEVDGSWTTVTGLSTFHGVQEPRLKRSKRTVAVKLDIRIVGRLYWADRGRAQNTMI
jgi:hypothetical protein